MTITIIIATFNAAKTLRCCLDSIVPQLTTETELILVDGGSKDETNAIIDSYGDKVSVHISEPDNGIYDAWNKGVKAAHGDWVMFVGADDKLMPSTIRDYITFIKDLDSDIDLISSKRRMVSVNGLKIYDVGTQWVWPSCLFGMPISHPGALHSMRLFEEVGLYNVSFKVAADYELLLRKKEKMQTAFLDKVTIEVSEGGISDSYKSVMEYYRVLRNCPDITMLKSFVLFTNMYIRFSVKKFFKLFNINLHS